MRSKKTIILLAALVVGIGAGILFYQTTRASASVSDKDLITVQRMDFPMLVDATGLLEAPKSVSIGPPQIHRERRFKLARMVDEGTQVHEGDFLMEFDGSDISSRLRTATANFQSVQETYQKKRSDFDIKMRDLRLQLEQAKSNYQKLDAKLNQQAEVEAAITIEETRIQRDAAKKTVDLLEKKVAYTQKSGELDLQISRSNETHYRSMMEDLMDAMDSLTVRSPVSGVVIYKRDWNNEPRQVGSNIFMLDTVMEIPDLSTLRVKALVDEIDEGKVKVGQPARISIDALQGHVFTGKVTEVSTILKQAAYDRPQKVAETLVEIEDKDLEVLRPGMSARVQVQVGMHKNVVVIPLSSIMERGGRSFVQVWKPQEKKWEWREIELLTNDDLSAVVGSGLEANEMIRVKPVA